MKQIILITILFFVTVYVYCNNDLDENNESYEIKFYLFAEPNIILSKQIFGNINIALGFDRILKKNIEGMILHGPIIGFETNFIPNDYIYGIKTGYFIDYVHFFGLSFRLNSIMYNNSANQWDIRIQPEIGLTIFGVLGVTYGYNFTLLETKNRGIGNHRVSLFYRIALLGYYGNKKWVPFPIN